MTTGGETADQMTRMTLQGIEVAANVALKAGGMASKSLAAMLYAILTDKKKVKGKARLNSMLKSGKELKVFAIHHNDLKVFCQEAKRYGVMYCVLKEKNNTDGICDIMVRAEDASKISRIVDKFELATVDAKTINDYATSKQNQTFKDVPTMSDEEHDKLVKSLMNSMKKEEKSFSENPTIARTTKDASPFEPTSVKAGKEPNIIDKRPSVRKELNEIKKQQEKKRTVKQQSQHKNIKKKRIKKKVR